MRNIEYNEQSMGSKKEDFIWTLKDDYAFKRLLGVEENKPILQDFLECVLNLEHEEIIGLELLDKELKKDHAEDRTGILDIQVRLKDGTLIDIEMQAVWENFFIDRSFAYLNKMYTSELKAAETMEERNMLALSSPILQLLNEKVVEITRTPEEQRRFDSRMKMRSDILGEIELNYNEGFEKGIEKGREEGVYNNKLETVKKAQVMGLPIESIIELTGLTEAEILKLK